MKKLLLPLSLVLISIVAYAQPSAVTGNFENTIHCAGTVAKETHYQNWNSTVTLHPPRSAVIKTYCQSLDCDGFVRVVMADRLYCIIHAGSNPAMHNVVQVVDNGKHGLYCTVKTTKTGTNQDFETYYTEVTASPVK